MAARRADSRDFSTKRGNIQLAQAAKEAPHVLNFAAEVVLDGCTLEFVEARLDASRR